MRAALSFLTPLGGPAPVSSSALSWFPVVGAGLGLVLGMAWWAAAGVWPPLVDPFRRHEHTYHLYYLDRAGDLSLLAGSPPTDSQLPLD
jgi:hypothetical protein